MSISSPLGKEVVSCGGQSRSSSPFWSEVLSGVCRPQPAALTFFDFDSGLTWQKGRATLNSSDISLFQRLFSRKNMALEACLLRTWASDDDDDDE